MTGNQNFKRLTNRWRIRSLLERHKRCKDNGNQVLGSLICLDNAGHVHNAIGMTSIRALAVYFSLKTLFQKLGRHDKNDLTQ